MSQLRFLRNRLSSRLRTFVEAVVDERLSKQQARSDEPPGRGRMHTGNAQLPDDLEVVHVPLKEGVSFKLVVDAQPGPFERNVVRSPYVSGIAELLMEELDGRGTLIDLGANIGTVAMPVAAMGSKVVGIEMLPRNCLKLLHAVLQNGYADVRLRQAAVSASDGIVSYGGTEAWGAVVQAGNQLAMSLRLDTIIAEIELAEPQFIEDPVALKIDIEGHEYQALQGAKRFLEARRPVVIFESITTHDDAFNTHLSKQYFEDHRYQLYMLLGRILVPKTPDDIQEEHVADFLAIPNERVESTIQRLANYEVRQLSMDERIRVLARLVTDGPNHCRHAARVLDRLASDIPEFAARTSDLRSEVDRRLVELG